MDDFVDLHSEPEDDEDLPSWFAQVCEWCSFYHKNSSECRRHCPRSNDGFPKVNSMDWCGDGFWDYEFLHDYEKVMPDGS